MIYFVYNIIRANVYLIILVPGIDIEFPDNDNYCRETAYRMTLRKLPPVTNYSSLGKKRKSRRPQNVTEAVIPVERPQNVTETVIPLVEKRKRGRPRKQQSLY